MKIFCNIVDESPPLTIIDRATGFSKELSLAGRFELCMENDHLIWKKNGDLQEGLPTLHQKIERQITRAISAPTGISYYEELSSTFDRQTYDKAMNNDAPEYQVSGSF